MKSSRGLGASKSSTKLKGKNFSGLVSALAAICSAHVQFVHLYPSLLILFGVWWRQSYERKGLTFWYHLSWCVKSAFAPLTKPTAPLYFHSLLLLPALYSTPTCAVLTLFSLSCPFHLTTCSFSCPLHRFSLQLHKPQHSNSTSTNALFRLKAVAAQVIGWLQELSWFRYFQMDVKQLPLPVSNSLSRSSPTC